MPSRIRYALARRSTIALAAFGIAGCGTLLSISPDDVGSPDRDASTSESGGDGDVTNEAGGSDGGSNADGGSDAAHFTGKVVFVTDSKYTGNLGGFPGGNTICNNEAIDAGLTGVFTAYLATAIGTAPALPAVDGGWSRVDGKPVFNGGPVGTTPGIAIAVTAKGVLLTLAEGAWTGLTSDSASTLCGTWTVDGTGVAGFGEPTALNNTWRANGPSIFSCGSAHRLYCFQQ